MTEIDPSQILLDKDCIYFRGVKYQKVEEQKSFYDKLWEELGKKVGYGIDCDQLTDRIMDLIKDNFPEPKEEFQPSPQTPEQVAEGLRDAMKQAKKDGVFDVVDEPYRNVRAYWDEKDNPASYITDEVVNRLIEKHKSQKLWNILKDKWGFPEDACGDIVEAVAEWLPKEQSSEGSQNVDTELLVDGFNHCLQKMKEMLR
jgi:hypothetical protein